MYESLLLWPLHCVSVCLGTYGIVSKEAWKRSMSRLLFTTARHPCLQLPLARTIACIEPGQPTLRVYYPNAYAFSQCRRLRTWHRLPHQHPTFPAGPPRSPQKCCRGHIRQEHAHVAWRTIPAQPSHTRAHAKCNPRLPARHRCPRAARTALQVLGTRLSCQRRGAA